MAVLIANTVLKSTYTSEPGSSSCKLCETGHYSDQKGKSFCKRCSFGKVQSQPGQEKCEVCQKGKYADSEVEECKSCPAGWYQQSEEMNRCFACDAGRFANVNGSRSCISCPVGKYASNKSSTKCTWLEYGYVSDPQKVSQIPIPDGHSISQNRMMVYPCSVGTYGPLWSDKTMNKDLQKVWRNQSRLEALLSGDRMGHGLCETCPVGYSTMNVTRMTACRACSPGKYANMAGSGECVECKDMHGFMSYQDEEGQGACKECPVGYISQRDQCESEIDPTLPLINPPKVSLMSSSVATAVQWSQRNLSMRKEALDVGMIDLRYSLKIEWRTNLTDVQGFKVEWSYDKIFSPQNTSSKEVKAGTFFYIAHGFQHAPWDRVLYARVSYVQQRTGSRSDWSTSEKWVVHGNCELGEYLNLSKSRNHLNVKDPSTYACWPCPMGGSCRTKKQQRATQLDIVAKFGWWQCPPESQTEAGLLSEPKFEKCPYSPACLGGENRDLLNLYRSEDGDPAEADLSVSMCLYPGHRGPPSQNRLCSSCAPGYVDHGDYGECKKCNDDPVGSYVYVAGLTLGSIMILALLIMLKMRSSGEKAKHSVLKRVLVSHLQLIGMVMSMNVPWPKSLLEAVSALSSLTTISRHITAIKCTASMSLSSSVTDAFYFYLILVLAAMLPIILSLLGYIYWIVCAPFSKWMRCGKELRSSHCFFCCVKSAKYESKPTFGGDEYSTFDGWLVTTVLIVYLIQPSIVRMGFQALECTEVCGDQWLHVSSDVRCWEGTHLWFTILGSVPLLLIYVILAPTVMLVLLWRQRADLTAKHVVFRYGLLYSGYRRERWWWEAAVLIRKVGIIVVITFARLNTHQVHFALLVIAMFTYAHLVERPFGGTPGWIAQDYKERQNKFISNLDEPSLYNESEVINGPGRHSRSSTRLAVGWVKHTTDDDKVYYVSPEGKSQWEKPLGKNARVRRTSMLDQFGLYISSVKERFRHGLRSIRKDGDETKSEDDARLLLHRTELLSLLCMFVMLWMSMFFSVAECSENETTCLILGIFLVVMNCAFVVYCSYHMWAAFVAKNKLHQKIQKHMRAVTRKINLQVVSNPLEGKLSMKTGEAKTPETLSIELTKL